MNSEGKPLPVIRVEPLAYLVELQAFLRKSDPEVWDWLAKQRTSAKYAEDLRFELLKSTYRVERGSQPELYAAAEEVKAMLALDAPLTIYQSQNPEGLNASLAYVAGEIHVVLHGAIATHLSPLELRGLFGHELGHYLLRHWPTGAIVACCSDC